MATLLYLLLGLSMVAMAVVLGLTLHGFWGWGCVYWRSLGQKSLRLQVQKRRDATEDLFILHLVRAGAMGYLWPWLPAFQAGQYLTLIVPGENTHTVRRAYSLAAWQQRSTHYELAIKREAQGVGSGWLHQNARVNTLLQAKPPQGHFVLQSGTHPVVLLAGGIGITPLRAMLHRLAQQPEPPPTLLFFAARNRDGLLYTKEFSALAASACWFDYAPILSRPGGEWQGLSGRLTAEQVLTWPQAYKADFYLCGGNALMQALTEGLMQAGIAPERLHQEAFTLPQNEDEQIYKICIDGREKAFQGQGSLLQALESWQLPVEGDCRAGDCGRCRVRLRQGKVRWLLPELAALSNPSEILSCCTLPLSDLELELDSA